MLISCPKCNAVYKVSENQIPQNGKKFKCAECANIWLVKPKDAKTLEPENKSNTQIKPQIVRPVSRNTITSDNKSDDIQDMFTKLSQDTKGLFNGQNQPSQSKEKIIRTLKLFFSPFMINCSLLLCIFCFTFFIGYVNRFEIIAYIPRLENFYEKFGIDCYYKARDIVFSNVKVKNIERKGLPFIEISGLLINNGNYTSKILPIKATIRTNDGTIESEVKKTLTLHKLEPEFRAVFRIVIPNKTPDAKKVVLTFEE